MKKTLILSLVCLSLAMVAHAQNPQRAELLKQLNRDIWTPFTEAYAAVDAEKYLKLHSAELIRGEGDRGQVLSLAQYSEGVRRSFERWKKDGAKVGIQFRFLERIVSEESASERGIYQLSVTRPGQEARSFYGKFHVFSRKENGVWKILIDYDSSEKDTIDEKAFQAGTAVDDYGKESDK
jgi:ketosteroid isomerase-like protein